MPDTQDADLMCAAAGGDAAAFAALIRRHAGPLLRFMTRIEGDLHAAEDVVQDCLLSVWKYRNQFDRVRGFKPWLYRIALNRSHELHRKRSLTFASQSPHDIGASDGSPDSCAVAVETANLVIAAVDELPPTQRAVVLLRIWECLPYSDIAFALAVSEGTARSHMSYALMGLRKSLRHIE